MANDDRSTVRPPGGPRSSGIHPPRDERFAVQLYYPNSIAVARALCTHLHKRVENTLRRADVGQKGRAYAGLVLDTAVYEKLNEYIRGVIVNTLIVGVDEFCDTRTLFQEVKRFYADNTPIIVHITAPHEIDITPFIDHGAVGVFSEYNFSQVDSLLDDIAQTKLKPREIVIDED
jgi:hypothetical protein